MKGNQAFSLYSIELKDKFGNKIQSIGNNKDKEIQSVIRDGKKFEEYEEDQTMLEDECIAGMKMGYGNEY